ncbi:hypothetical protein N7403_31835 [Pseudomonas nitroreducens]|uniref:hypothetical protein n=1 Tax=Pseudomonas nitroreducens TaxID=46680 RepID=UPI0024480E55|nr:hypothetical protein [Pseudomonas nitroreducens]MDG9858465.1 hypothetical protein [Pseudomonas nitroreducens]
MTAIRKLQEAYDALQSIMEWTAAGNIPAANKLCLIRNAARAALQKPIPEPPKLSKTREQWEKVDPAFCAEHNSPAANMHLINDAKRDIEQLHRALSAGVRTTP